MTITRFMYIYIYLGQDYFKSQGEPMVKGRQDKQAGWICIEIYIELPEHTAENPNLA